MSKSEMKNTKLQQMNLQWRIDTNENFFRLYIGAAPKALCALSFDYWKTEGRYTRASVEHVFGAYGYGCELTDTFVIETETTLEIFHKFISKVEDEMLNLLFKITNNGPYVKVIDNAALYQRFSEILIENDVAAEKRDKHKIAKEAEFFTELKQLLIKYRQLDKDYKEDKDDD